MLTSTEANALADELKKTGSTEWARLGRFTRYARGRQPDPWLPAGTDEEYRKIAKKSASNWLDLVVRATAQGLYVVGYGDQTNESVVWRDGWQRNGLDARQHALFRAALIHGYAYLVVMPAVDADGQPDGVWVRPEAATALYASYVEPGDEWPEYAVRVISKDHLELYDDEARYTIRNRQVVVTKHGQGVTPVVQVARAIDLLGPPMGEIEPVTAIQDRIVDATFNLQMVAKYGAFPQRWIAGLDPTAPLTDADGNIITDSDGNPTIPRIKAYVDSILTAIDKDTKFGQFSAADLGQFVAALEAHIRHLAAITQTPPHYLLGALVNLSAEALAAAEAGLQRKIGETREVLGEGLEQAMRLMAAVLGDDAAAADESSQMRWADVESRSLAQTADALLKLQQMGVPNEKLFPMIPGWTKTDVDEALALIETAPTPVPPAPVTGDGPPSPQ